MLRVVCGFQSGVDIGGIRAAHAAGLPTSGWMPAGFRTEDGPRPEYVTLYGAKEHASADYPGRTAANVLEAETTVWFGPTGSPGYHCTRNATLKYHKAFWEVGDDPAELIAKRIVLLDVGSINISGSRESSRPGIAAAAEAYFGEVFRVLNDLNLSQSQEQL